MPVADDSINSIRSAWSENDFAGEKEYRLHGEVVISGNFLTMCRDTVALPDGSVGIREYVLHPGAVVVVAFLTNPVDERLVVEWQYRYPVEQTMFEFPAGKLDMGESQIECAVRELQEETGFTALEWAPAGVVYPAIGYSNEFIGIWFARGLTCGPQSLDQGEFIDVRSTSIEELLYAIAEGLITDGKTLACISFIQAMQSGRWKPEWRPASMWREQRDDHRAMPKVKRTLCDESGRGSA